MLTLDLLVNGLVIGVFYALMAIGLSLIFGILKIVNFAHGEFYMVGAYAYTLSALSLGISPWLSLPFALLVGLILGLVVERRRLAGEKDGLMWFCQACNHKLYEAYFPLGSIESDFPPVFERFYRSREARTCTVCGTVHPAPPAYAD